ncbi:MAG: N-acetylmuramoyl-L-alanine amidase [Leptolyngbyaceae bacterium]|nr:N-acetylmuramoyl-L-alanine amidase [Leptolyngbyaceae bacterium]
MIIRRGLSKNTSAWSFIDYADGSKSSLAKEYSRREGRSPRLGRTSCFTLQILLVFRNGFYDGRWFFSSTHSVVRHVNARCLISSLLGPLAMLLVALPVGAAQLQFWRFNAAENRLVFTTDESVRPRAQLVRNPTRVVIDLPGVQIGSVARSQLAASEAVREVRVGQFDGETTRLVIEFNPGYTVDPQAVVVRGSTPTQWIVELPEPQREDGSPIASSSNLPTSERSSTEPASLVEGAATRLDGVRVTQSGLFLETAGAVPEMDIDRSRRRGRVTLELENTSLSTEIEEVVELNQFGVEEIQFEQKDDDPPTVEVRLELEEDDETNWRASATNLGGIALVPVGSSISTGVNRPQQPLPTPSRPAPAQAAPVIATIQQVEVANNGTQLVIRSDTPISSYTSGWDRRTTDYQIVINNARLAGAIADPQIPEGGPLRRIRLREENNTVIVSLAPTSGVQIGDVIQPSQQLLALGLQGRPVAAPGFTPAAPIQLPNVAGRAIVMIDPGHGGRDPGAIGIGGLRETTVVLPISLQVANLLQQQGVNVVMTRTTDQTVSLEGRVQMAERANASIFVSIHANAISLSRPDVNGIETYYASPQGARLARAIHNSMLQAVGGPDRGVRQSRFFVLRRTSMPAALVETGFVTGARDAPLLNDPAYRERLAQAIARGILLYLQGY